MNVEEMLVSSIFFFKQRTAYEMRISDWSSDVCSSDLPRRHSFHAKPRSHRICGRDFAPPAASVSSAVASPDLKDGVGRRVAIRQAREEIGRASCRERVCQYV